MEKKCIGDRAGVRKRTSEKEKKKKKREREREKRETCETEKTRETLIFLIDDVIISYWLA